MSGYWEHNLYPSLFRGLVLDSYLSSHGLSEEAELSHGDAA